MQNWNSLVKLVVVCVYKCYVLYMLVLFIIPEKNDYALDLHRERHYKMMADVCLSVDPYVLSRALA